MVLDSSESEDADLCVLVHFWPEDGALVYYDPQQKAMVLEYTEHADAAALPGCDDQVPGLWSEAEVLAGVVTSAHQKVRFVLLRQGAARRPVRMPYSTGMAWRQRSSRGYTPRLRLNVVAELPGNGKLHTGGGTRWYAPFWWRQPDPRCASHR